MRVIRLLVDTVCGGAPTAAGAVVEASDSDAAVLITMGRAEPVDAPAPPQDDPGLSPDNRAIGLPGAAPGAGLSKRRPGK